MTYSTQLLSFSFPFVVNILHAVLLIVTYLNLLTVDIDLLCFSNIIFSVSVFGRAFFNIIMTLVKSKFGSETHFNGGLVVGSLLYYLTILVFYIIMSIRRYKPEYENSVCSMTLYIISLLSLVSYLVYSVFYLNETRLYFNHVVYAKENEKKTFKSTSIINTVLLPLLAKFDDEVAHLLSKAKLQ